ncbi:hypothetical protein G9396_20100 [Providencia rettgeri]|nr:hypothetical protein G9396_20100 [Providencia rettgeri]
MMQKYTKKNTTCFLTTALLSLCLGYSPFPLLAGSQTLPLNFKLTLQRGTCDISISKPSIIFADTIWKDIVKAADSGVTPQKFSIMFSGKSCAYSGITPKLRVVGTTITQGTTTLFRNNVTTGSVGFGVRLKEDKVNGAVLANGSVISLTPVAGQPNKLTDLKLEAALSCGTCQEGTGLKAGTVNATITYQFLYE